MIFQGNIFFPTIFFITLAVSIFSAILLLVRRIPLNYIQIHIGIIALPPITAVMALIVNHKATIFGPWNFDPLSWLVAAFVLSIGLIVQKFSLHFLWGDRCYRKYFSLLTITTAMDALAWLCNDMRVLLLCWGCTLFCLTQIIRLKREWKVVKRVSFTIGRIFLLSWLFLLAAILWLGCTTGHWELTLALTKNNLLPLEVWEKTCINLLLVLSMLIPAAQWPFNRWLLDSVIAPTPISAVMHAGIVNAGGIMLTRFALLLSGNVMQWILLALSSMSILIGTGIMLVHVDYKRQLVGSTMAQMGFMLIQCALGAYLAAIIHAILHGFFKSTLFLQAGSAALHYHEPKHQKIRPTSYFFGGLLGILTGICYWVISPNDTYQVVEAFILGCSAAIAWTQLHAFEKSHFVRISGLFLFSGAVMVYYFIHFVFYRMLQGVVQEQLQSPVMSTGLFLVFLIISSVFVMWLACHRSSNVYMVIYLWLVRLGEPHKDLIESHPKYLTNYRYKGGSL